jgi:beta-galactosidase
METGLQQAFPLKFPIPAGTAPGHHLLRLSVRFANGETQTDEFAFEVVRPTEPLPPLGRLALFDPKGETAAELRRWGIVAQAVGPADDLRGFDTLIIGKSALSPEGASPSLDRVREGLKVIVFEQSAAVLERRLGFRVAEYGLRQVFARVPDHPIISGLDPEELRDWRGSATLQAEQLNYTLRPRYGPTVEWAGLPLPRLWRCGNRGNVASVLIEKPARGDFLSLLDGGYSLQYSPLLEFREGRGVILFCQLDLTGRSEVDPVADGITKNLLRYVAQWKPGVPRTLTYSGDVEGREHLRAAGFLLKEAAPSVNDLAVFWRSNEPARPLAMFSSAGPLDPGVSTRSAEHISAYFAAPGTNSVFRGLGPADFHNRNPRNFTLLTGGGEILGDGVIGSAKNQSMVFCQMLPWQFDPAGPENQKRTFRRSAAALTRILSNLGAESQTPLVGRFANPVTVAEKRWRDGLYLDQPEEWDYPYRFFRW